MKEVIQELRNNIKKMLNVQLGYRRAYQALTWAPGVMDEVRRIRATKELGKRALKPYRLEGTTEDRMRLLSGKDNWSLRMRMSLVALGLLRGMPYRRIEAYTEDLIDAGDLHGFIVGLGVKDFTRDEVFGWLEGDVESLRGAA